VIMNERIYTISETDLASRYSASRLRALVEEALAQGNSIVIDLKPVLSVSESYADELFGVLAARWGLEKFVEHVYIRDAAPPVFHAIASAVQRRLNQNAPTPDFALSAAKQALLLRREISS